MATYLLGIDIGTTASKALLIRADGAVAAEAMADHAYSSPQPGWAEQDPRDWWEATCRCCQEIIERAGIDPGEIASIGLTGQMHGLVALDQDGQPLRPCIMWNDQRAVRQCAEIEKRVSRDELIRIAGKPAGPNFTAAKLLWMAEHEPELYGRIATIMLTKDYVRSRLTGKIATDVNDASGTLLFDVGKRAWSDKLLHTLEIPRAWLPEVLESSEVCGSVTGEAAKLTGLREGTPVIAGCGDQAADAIGLGIIASGQTSVTLGTSGVIFTSFEKYQPDPAGTLHAYCHALPGHWHLMGVMLSAGGSLRWFRDELGSEECARATRDMRDPYDALTELAATAPAGCDGLFFLPYLTGERVPHADPMARGGFIGLTIRHTRAHMVRSVMEGVAFGLADCLGLVRELGISIGEVRASGSGIRSGLWRQILADVLNVQITTLNTDRGAAFGAAILAGIGAGVYVDAVSATSAIIRETGCTRPGANAELYPSRYEIYRGLYPALRETFQAISDLSGK